VVEELAADGVMLARLGYTLRLTLSGGGAEISLLDQLTQRPLSSTTIAELARDREAAVATITQIAANLVSQQANVTALPPVATVQTQPAPPSWSNPAPDPAEGELRFRREAIGFNDTFVVQGGTVTSGGGRLWTPWQGELHLKLTPQQFYSLVNRPDLLAAHQSRRSTGTVVAVVGGLAMVGGAVFAVSDIKNGGPGRFLAGMGIEVAGGVLFGIGLWYLITPPIDEGQAKALAQQYNDNLRRKYGLPVAMRQRRDAHRFSQVALTPFAGENRGGLVLSGRF
jgi:hypothetical protein